MLVDGQSGTKSGLTATVMPVHYAHPAHFLAVKTGVQRDKKPYLFLKGCQARKAHSYTSERPVFRRNKV